MEQGVPLMDLVIDQVRSDPRCIAGFCGDRPLHAAHPIPTEVVEHLAFPSGKPLAPSLKRWLEFDGSWLHDLGWFSALEPVGFTPRRLDEIVEDEFELWGDFYKPLGQRLNECFLLPGGSDSRRIYAVAEPDGTGEYPVLVIDTDDVPYAAVMYPGFDVFMADEAGLLGLDFDTYEGLSEDRRYAARLKEHACHLFNGKQGIECFEEEWGSS
jgi:hypothetical protein